MPEQVRINPGASFTPSHVDAPSPEQGCHLKRQKTTNSRDNQQVPAEGHRIYPKFHLEKNRNAPLRQLIPNTQQASKNPPVKILNYLIPF